MKKFKNVGYIPYRQDRESHPDTYGKFFLDYVLFDQEDEYGNGDTLLTLEWFTYAPSDNPRWCQPSLIIDTSHHSRDSYAMFTIGSSVLKFIVKHFGYTVEDEMARRLPEEQAIKDAKYNIDRGKTYYKYDPLFRDLAPEVVVHMANKAFGIHRVVFDARLNKHVIIDNMAPTNADVWKAQVNGYFLGEAIASDVFEAKNALIEVVHNEQVAIEGHHTTKWHRRESDKQKFADYVEEWRDQGTQVTKLGRMAPEVGSIYELLDVEARWCGVRKV